VAGRTVECNVTTLGGRVDSYSLAVPFHMEFLLSVKHSSPLPEHGLQSSPRPRPFFRKLHCITSMLGRSNGEVAWRTMGFRLFAGLGISGVIPSVVAVNVERRHNSDHVIYC